MGNPPQAQQPPAANAPQPGQQPPGGVNTNGGSRSGFPYEPQPGLAKLFFVAAILTVLVESILCVRAGKTIEQSQQWLTQHCVGGAAAVVGILLVIGLLLQAPALILDDSPQAGGEPSTMRILSLAIVLTFVALALRAGWYSGGLPNLDSNWVWLVTAALGGKAIQAFAEMKDKK